MSRIATRIQRIIIPPIIAPEPFIITFPYLGFHAPPGKARIPAVHA
jgi:hypothetical protein